jgi:hypothetical protein
MAAAWRIMAAGVKRQRNENSENEMTQLRHGMV